MAVSVPRFEGWLTAPAVEALADSLGEDTAARSLRQDRFRAFLELPVEPNPLYRGYANIAGADLIGLEPSGTGPAAAVPPVDATSVRVIHDRSGTRAELPEALRSVGVRVETDPRSVDSFHEVPIASDKLQALSLALLNRVVRIEVPDHCPLPVRVQDLTILSQPHESLSVHRSLHAGEGSRVLYSEEVYATEDDARTGARFYGSVDSVQVATDASVHFLTVHAPDSRAVSVYDRHATVGAHGRMAWIWAGFGGFRTRSKNLSELPGQGSAVDDLQTFFGHTDQAYDSSVQISHIGTDTHGQSITRGVFRDHARGVSRGLVRIEKDARKTLSYLSEHAMLLSKGARSDTIPVLEILCRDVKATHSSSVAPVDPEKVFYLNSRGIDASDAVRMIGEGFLSHVLERASIAGLRDHLYPLLSARWDLQPVLWQPAHFPALPALDVNDAAQAGEWRFDAKLRA